MKTLESKYNLFKKQLDKMGVDVGFYDVVLSNLMLDKSVKIPVAPVIDMMKTELTRQHLIKIIRAMRESLACVGLLTEEEINSRPYYDNMGPDDLRPIAHAFKTRLVNRGLIGKNPVHVSKWDRIGNQPRWLVEGKPVLIQAGYFVNCSLMTKIWIFLQPNTDNHGEAGYKAGFEVAYRFQRSEDFGVKLEQHELNLKFNLIEVDIHRWKFEEIWMLLKLSIKGCRTAPRCIRDATWIEALGKAKKAYKADFDNIDF